jgi:hypothetical protein
MRPLLSSTIVALALPALSLSACDQDERAAAVRPASADELLRANAVARAYVRAAVARDPARRCALRTRRSVRLLGGPAGCRKRNDPLTLGPLREGVSPGTVRAIDRKARALDPSKVRVVPADTAGERGEARVVLDFGEALIESGHAVGGEILEMELRRERRGYRVHTIGFAAFAD